MVDYNEKETSGVLTTVNKQYHGITDENRLYWCHGTVGIEHRKVRKFRYPLWKYAHVSPRVIWCMCVNCNMHFYGELAKDVPLHIVVIRLDSYFGVEIPVRVNQKPAVLRGERVRPFRHVSQEMLVDETRLFIELVQ